MCLFLLFQVRIENNIPESTWVEKREDIANGICKLGASYRQILRDGWVRYHSQKNAAGGVGQSARQVETYCPSQDIPQKTDLCNIFFYEMFCIEHEVEVA